MIILNYGIILHNYNYYCLSSDKASPAPGMNTIKIPFTLHASAAHDRHNVRTWHNSLLLHTCGAVGDCPEVH